MPELHAGTDDRTGGGQAALTAATARVDPEDITLSDIRRSQKAQPVGFHVYEVPLLNRFMETGSRWR